MGIFDKLKSLVGGHEEQADKAIDKAGDAADEKTGSKYSEQVDKAQDTAKDYVDGDKGGSGS